MDRRKFLKNTAIISTGMTFLGSEVLAKKAGSTNPYEFIQLRQSPLTYGIDGLEPKISSQIMDLHYNKHAAGYLKKTNKFLQENKIKEQNLAALIQSDMSDTFLINNLGGHFNHEIFWHSMTPQKTTLVGTKLLAQIIKDFGGWKQFLEQFHSAASKVFGSGWAWLCWDDRSRKLIITTTANQNNPMMKSENKGYPIIGIDVWEHAYYLQYQNRRAEYITNWEEIINWDFANQMFSSILNWKN